MAKGLKGFQKGHPVFCKNPGPKKQPSTLLKEALNELDADIPAIFAMLRQKALEGDKDAAFYLINQRLGKPTERHEVSGAPERPLKIEFILKRKGVNNANFKG